MFLHELLQVGLYPLTSAAPLSIDTMLVKLKSFRMFEIPKAMAFTTSPCSSCNTNFNEAVVRLRRDAEDRFKGFCLDCIQLSGSEGVPCRVKDAMHVVQPDLE